MKNTDDHKKQSYSKTYNSKDELILQLEKKIAVGVWIKVIGQIIEVTNLSKLVSISEELKSDYNEQQVLLGVWIQTIGQLLEGIGVTEQTIADNEFIQLEGQKVTVKGELLQIIGTAIEANAGARIITEETRNAAFFNFIP